MDNLHMYLMVFPSPNESQISDIRSTFSDFDWGRGFAVVEVVCNEVINGKLIIQFVSEKQFVVQKMSGKFELKKEDVDEVITGKGQYFGTLYAIGHDTLEAYFGYLGIASDTRNSDCEIIYKVEIDKYSQLIETTLRLEDLMK